MDKKTLFIVGAGFVGGTCYEAFHKLKNWNVKIFDKDPDNSLLAQRMSGISWAKEFQEVANVDVVFVAVPTPMIEETGECYTGIVKSVIKQVRVFNQDAWVCVKSTIPPGTTQAFNNLYSRVCFNPEFLTEKNAFNDFVELRYQIIGYPELMAGIWDSLDCPVQELYKDAYDQNLVEGGENIIEMSSTQAEMVKYTRNTYLATRLSFFNEIKQICDKIDVDYRAMKYYAGLDTRVGRHYSNVETPYGFGGHCLPKDLNALKSLAKKRGVKTTVLDAVNEKNLEVRETRDWEQMTNRAVIKLEDK